MEYVNRRVWWALGLLSLLGAAVSCNVYDATALDQLRTEGRRPPPRPDVPNGEDIPGAITVAMRGPVLNQSDGRWRDIGVNLDGRITTEEDLTNVECSPPHVNGTIAIDGEDGIDNVFGSDFFPLIEITMATLEADARLSQELGQGTLLLQMSNWNGTRNDPRVRVVVTQAVAGTSADPADVHFVDGELVMTADGTPAPPPAWEGEDSWWARDESFIEGDVTNPRIVDNNAYVNDGVVVFRLPARAEILFFVEDKGVKTLLTDGIAFAEMNEDFTRLGVATVAGRWAISDLIDTSLNIGICPGGTRNLLTASLHRMADVLSNPPADPSLAGPDAECDAISMGILFEEGVVGHFVDLADSPPLPNPCATE